MKIKLPEVMTAVFILLVSVFTFKPAYDYTVVRLLIANIFVLLCALYFLKRRQPFSVPLPVLLSLTGFVLFVAISVGFSVFPPATFRELPHFITYILLFLVASQIYPTPLVIGSWITAAVILSFLGLYDYSRMQMVVTPLGNKNFFAGYLILVIPITIAILWQKILTLRTCLVEQTSRLSTTHSVIARRHMTQQSKPLKRDCFAKHRRPFPEHWKGHPCNDYLSLIGLILAVVLFFILLVLADSQASQAGLVIGLLFLTFVAFGKFAMPRLKPGLRILILSVLIIALALGVFIGVKKGMPYILKNVRYPLWKGSADMVIQKPVTGFGPGTFLSVFQRFRPADYYNRPEVAPLSDHSHNEYLELASESGLPSLLLFLTFLASILVPSFRRMKNNDVITGPKTSEISSEWFLLAGLLSGLTAILIDGLFSTNLRTFPVAPVFYLVLGFCSAITAADILKTRPVSNPKSPAHPSFIWIAIMALSVFSAGLIVREIKGQVCYKEGIAARNAQNWSGAIAKYRKALELDPANLQAAYKLGFVYASANRTEEAINLYREILRISPNFAKTYYNLALLSLRSNDLDSAVAYLNLTLRYDPYDTEAQKVINILKNPTAKPPGSP